MDALAEFSPRFYSQGGRVAIFAEGLGVAFGGSTWVDLEKNGGSLKYKIGGLAAKKDSKHWRLVG